MRKIDGYDVIVIGGGPGGFGAAVAAARGGARTLLLEREGCLGGGATTMLVHPMMSHMTSKGPHDEPARPVNAGIFKELTDRLIARGAGRDGRCIQFDDEVMKRVLDEMAAEAGVQTIFHAALFDAEVQGPRVTAARFSHNGGPLHVTGKVFVDGTGDALLAEAAGCEFQFGNESGTVMPMTLNFIVGGVDDEAFDGKKGALKELCRKGDKDEPPLINTNLSCSTRPKPGWVHFNAIRVTGSTLDPLDLSAAEIEARRRVDNFIAWARANVPGFAKAYLVKTGAHIGIRESRRVIGDYLLTVDDFDAASKFDDGICCCSYGIDVHGQKPNEVILRRVPPGQYYQIPYRCLTPKGRENLLMACRAVSADVMAHSSLRIMPVVMNIGEAAGFAAAMSLPAGDVRKIDIQKLRRQIRNHGGALEP